MAIVSPNSARFLVSFFGVSAARAGCSSRSTSGSTPTRSRYIVDHSGAEVLLVDPESTSRSRRWWRPSRVVLDGAADAELFAPTAPGREPRRAGRPTRRPTCSINYTSGTTARPRASQLTHRNCWLNATAFGWHTTVTDRDVLLHTLPMFHCNGWGMPYAVTAMGGRHVVLRKVDGEEILRRIESEGVTLLCGAPAVVAAILDAAAVRSRAGRRGTRPGDGAHRRGRRATAVAGRSSGSSPSSAGSSSRSTA